MFKFTKSQQSAIAAFKESLEGGEQVFMLNGAVNGYHRKRGTAFDRNMFLHIPEHTRSLLKAISCGFGS
ncbi:MAG: hypothetical protein HDR98_07485 [Bacteroides sp.]|nr:hypothetical protein [Bacteroides sp.]MBD5338946.1 hypothetical protein [Bacteroides sp.]